MMVVILLLAIHMNAFLKDKFYSLFADTYTEMNLFRGGTWGRRSEFLHTIKIRIISVFDLLFHQRLIG